MFVKNNYRYGASVKFDTAGTLKRLRRAEFKDGTGFDNATLAYNDSIKIVMFSRTMHDAEIVRVLFTRRFITGASCGGSIWGASVNTRAWLC